MFWKDERLTWEAAEFGNVSKLQVDYKNHCGIINYYKSIVIKFK